MKLNRVGEVHLFSYREKEGHIRHKFKRILNSQLKFKQRHNLPPPNLINDGSLTFDLKNGYLACLAIKSRFQADTTQT